jgi:hypothetical protein
MASASCDFDAGFVWDLIRDLRQATIHQSNEQ